MVDPMEPECWSWSEEVMTEFRFLNCSGSQICQSGEENSDSENRRKRVPGKGGHDPAGSQLSEGFTSLQNGVKKDLVSIPGINFRVSHGYCELSMARANPPKHICVIGFEGIPAKAISNRLPTLPAALDSGFRQE